MTHKDNNNLNPATANQASEYSIDHSHIDSMNGPKGVGRILRDARMAKGIGIEEVSRQLRLSALQISAIEQDDYEKLPGKTFLRGFIRNYANLVHLDPAPLLKMLPESVTTVSTAENTPFRGKQISFSSSHRNKARNHSLPIIAILAFFILGAYFLLGNQNQPQHRDPIADIVQETPRMESGTITKEIPLSLFAHSQEPAAMPDKTAKPDTSDVTLAIEKIKPEPKSAAATAAVAEQPDPVTQPAGRTALIADNTIGHLHFKFTADSWIKIVDGAGTNLGELVKKAGSEHIVSGKKPFSIILGNAPAVNLTYNDREINISSYQKQGGTARFTLD